MRAIFWIRILRRYIRAFEQLIFVKEKLTIKYSYEDVNIHKRKKGCA